MFQKESYERLNVFSKTKKTRWKMRAMCTSRRIIHNPVVFDTCCWWMCFHQSRVAVLVGESTCVAHWWWASFEFPSRFHYVCHDILVTCKMLVTRKILQSMRWWISHVRNPSIIRGVNVSGSSEPSLVDWMWDRVTRTDRPHLLQQLAF